MNKQGETLREFAISGNLVYKIEKAVQNLQENKLTPGEFAHLLQQESKIVAALIGKYQNQNVPELEALYAQLCHALGIYLQALHVLSAYGILSGNALQIAEFADDQLNIADQFIENLRVTQHAPAA